LQTSYLGMGTLIPRVYERLRVSAASISTLICYLSRTSTIFEFFEFFECGNQPSWAPPDLEGRRISGGAVGGWWCHCV